MRDRWIESDRGGVMDIQELERLREEKSRERRDLLLRVDQLDIKIKLLDKQISNLRFGIISVKKGFLFSGAPLLVIPELKIWGQCTWTWDMGQVVYAHTCHDNGTISVYGDPPDTRQAIGGYGGVPFEIVCKMRQAYLESVGDIPF